MAETGSARPTGAGDIENGSAPASVMVAGMNRELVAGQSFVFGRAESCDACLDPTDVGISRRAGSVDCVDRVWFVTNRSSSRPLSAVDPVGFRTVLAPGRRMAVDGRLAHCRRVADHGAGLARERRRGRWRQRPGRR